MVVVSRVLEPMTSELLEGETGPIPSDRTDSLPEAPQAASAIANRQTAICRLVETAKKPPLPQAPGYPQPDRFTARPTTHVMSLALLEQSRYMNPATLIDLIGQPEFQAGLGWGVVGALILLVARRRGGIAPCLGIVVAGASVYPAFQYADIDPLLPVGIALLAAGGSWIRRFPLFAVPMILAGAAALLRETSLPDPLWVRIGSIVFTLGGGWVIGSIDRDAAETGLPTVMATGTAFGVWATVPDTEMASVVIGALVATVLTAWPKARARIGQAGGYALAGTIAAAIALGGGARLGSIVGGWATLGLFTAAPALKGFVSRYRWWAVAVHAVLVILASRVAGFQDSPWAAAAIAIPVLVLVVSGVAFAWNATKSQLSRVD